MPERLQTTAESPNPKGIEFFGFNPRQKSLVREGVEDIGMPTDNIRSFTSKKPKKGEENIRGVYDPEAQDVGLFEPPEGEPPIAQQKTLVHEISHSNSPFNPRNEGIYGGQREQAEARMHVISIAKQSITTRKYLNGYQAYLHQLLERKEIDFVRFVEETHAIMVELRFTNPNHLMEIEKAQFDEIRRINGRKPNAGIRPVAILTSDIDAKKGNLVGVDRTISRLIPKLKTRKDIDNHVASVRQKFLERGPIFSNQLRKAA